MSDLSAEAATMTEQLTDEQVGEFEENGFVIVRGLFSSDEIDLLEAVTRADPGMSRGGVMKDADGGESRIWITSDVKEDIANAFAHSGRIVNPIQQLLGGPVYIWHYKMMLKEPRVGGAWEWHQDYGYWYGDKCLFPNLASCMIAVNRATKENGCLQVLRGSHLAGRIEHGSRGGQVGADPDRTDAMEKRLELVYGEMEPGDALFFHCNTLHRSDQNKSEYARWAFICCYNTVANAPFVSNDYHGKPDAAEVWPDERISELGKRQLEALASTKED
jgi:ectoine hydroxylase-related dioxygenase (phytanoyl-CoA dioxygenase family)